jgi:putative membrane protein
VSTPIETQAADDPRGAAGAAEHGVLEQDAEAGPGWRRLDARMLLVHPIVEVGKALPAIAGAFLAGRSSGGDAGSRWSLGIAALVIAFSLLRWFTTRYRIAGGQIQLRLGLVRRRTVAARLDRVRTVDVTSHALHRVLGLARVSIGTGTSDRKGRDKLVLDGLPAREAAGLRAELLHRSRAAPDAAESTGATDSAISLAKEAPGADEELASIQASWIRYAPFTLTGAVTGLALLGVVWRIVSEGHVNLSRLGPYHAAQRHLERWPTGIDILAVAGAVIAFIALASTVGYVLSFWRFRLTRHPGGTLHVTRGLITTRATSVERRRLLGAELSEPLLLRSVGGARTLAIATGLRVGRGSERGGEILLPPAPRDAAIAVAGAVIEVDPQRGAALFEDELTPHPAGALRRRITRAVGGAALLSAAAAILAWWAGSPSWVLLPALAPLLCALPLGVDRYRSLGHGLVDGYLVTRFGSVVRRRSALDVEGVIGWNIKTTFFQRRLGLATLVATTAAGRQGYPIADMAERDAAGFAEAVTPGLLAPFALSAEI